MGLTEDEFRERIEIIKDPETGQGFMLPERILERVYSCRNELQIKDVQTGDVHSLPKSGIPILLGGNYFFSEKGELPGAYTIPIPDVKKSIGGILKHPHPEGQWCVYPIGEIYLDGMQVNEIKPLNKEFSKIQAGGKEFRVLYKC